MIINESIGTDATPTNGSLVIKHQNTNGVSSIVFPSTNNASDYAYIKYSESVLLNGEQSVLMIGVENDATTADPQNTLFDEIWINLCGGIGTTRIKGTTILNNVYADKTYLTNKR